MIAGKRGGGGEQKLQRGAVDTSRRERCWSAEPRSSGLMENIWILEIVKIEMKALTDLQIEREKSGIRSRKEKEE